MQVEAYLTFGGNCEDALKFYEKALGGRIVEVHRYAGSPMDNPQQLQADLRRYARMIESSLSGASFAPRSESASAVQVERGIVLALALVESSNDESAAVERRAPAPAMVSWKSQVLPGRPPATKQGMSRFVSAGLSLIDQCLSLSNELHIVVLQPNFLLLQRRAIDHSICIHDALRFCRHIR